MVVDEHLVAEHAREAEAPDEVRPAQEIGVGARRRRDGGGAVLVSPLDDLAPCGPVLLAPREHVGERVDAQRELARALEGAHSRPRMHGSRTFSTLTPANSTPDLPGAGSKHCTARRPYEILTPIGLVPHPRIGSVWAANPSGKLSKSLAKVLSRTANTTTFEVALFRAALIKSESIWHPSAIPWWAILCTAQPASLWKISPAFLAMGIFPARPISEIPPPRDRRTHPS